MQNMANPLQLCGFEFIEFVGENAALDPIFQTLGFSPVAKHKSKNVTLWRQGGINLILNYEPHSYASEFFQQHGPGACAMAFRTQNATLAYQKALELGAVALENTIGPTEVKIPAIQGIGGAPIFLVDCDIYQQDFVFF